MNKFFMEYTLPYICKNCTASVILEDMGDDIIPLPASFSAFTDAPSDSYKAKDLTEMVIHKITIPEYSLPEYGYAIALSSILDDN